MAKTLGELDLEADKAWVVDWGKNRHYWAVLSKEDLAGKTVINELKKGDERTAEVNAIMETLYTLGDELELNLRKSNIKSEDVHYYSPEKFQVLRPFALGFTSKTVNEDKSSENLLDLMRLLNNRNYIACVMEMEEPGSTLRVTSHEITHCIADKLELSLDHSGLREGLTELFSAAAIVNKWPENELLKEYCELKNKHCHYSYITNFLYELMSDVSKKTGWPFSKVMKEFYKEYFTYGYEKIKGNYFNESVRHYLNEDPYELGEKMLNGKVKRELKSLIKKLRLPEQEDFNTIDLITYFDFEEDHVRVKKLPILLYALYHETLDQSLGDVEDPLDKDPYIYLKGCFNEKQFDDCLGRGPRVVSDLLKTFGIEENTCTQCPGLYCKLEGGNDKERINQCRSEINKFRGLMKLCRLYLGWRLRG